MVHDGHCDSCNHATHLLANILCETGHINCFLDLCSTKEIAINGIQWYENKFKTCGKIVVICTKESKNTYYNGHGMLCTYYFISNLFTLPVLLFTFYTVDFSSLFKTRFPNLNYNTEFGI